MSTASLASREKVAAAQAEATWTYGDLLAKYQPRVIHTDQNLDVVYGAIELLMKVKRPSPAQLQLLELFSTLVEKFESQSHPTPQATLAELLAHLIESRGVKQAEIATATGVSKSTISDVLKGRRALSVENIKRLSDFFCVDSSLFVDASTR